MSGVRDTDINLIQSAVRGNTEAFSTLFEHYFEPVYNFALWLSNDPHFAEDLTQETFIRAHKNLHKLGPPWNVRSWLYRMARNLYVDIRRREPTANPLDGQTPDETSEADPEYHLMMTELSGPVRSALQRLSPNHREALILREVEHLQYEDIAAVMGISLDNVKVVLHRARNSFKDVYGVRVLMEEPLPDCDVLNELLDLICDGGPMGDAEEAKVRDHIKDCPTCQQRKRSIAALAFLLGGQQVFRPQYATRQRIAEGVARGGGRRRERNHERSRSRIAPIVVAEIIIILLFWLWRFMGLPDPTGGRLPIIFGGGDGRGGGAETGSPTPVPASFERPPGEDGSVTPGAAAALCTPDPNDGVCSACENTDLDSNACVCNMDGVCGLGEGYNCGDCQADSSGGSNAPKCKCVCDVFNIPTKKCIQGHNTCTNAFCLP